MSTTNEDERVADHDHDVVIIGGGPAGCSAGVFVGREGLDTVIFDRGRSSLLRCGHLENYLGFPGGIDIETFYDLMHDHAETAGCEIVPDMVESVEPVEDGDGWDEHVDEWFDDEILPADHNLDEAAIEAARADLKGGFLGRCIDGEERQRRDRAGQRQLLEHLDDDLIREYTETLKQRL